MPGGGMTADEILAAIAAECPGVRAAGPADAVAGVAPACVAFPTTVEEAAAALRAAAALGLAVVPRGHGTRLSLGTPPARCDLIVDTTRMDRVIEHAAGDLVVRVQAGATMGRLAATLAAAGQRLAVDSPASATVGGVIATGAAGPLRLRYGAPRDLLIGITLVRADGRVARSGGKVVKNVAGYDLGKLLAGSHGTLGLIADATFRLHPVPPARAFITGEYSGGSGYQPDAGTLALLTGQDSPVGHGSYAAANVSAAHAVTAAAGSRLLPSAVEIDRSWPGGPVRLGVLLEGTDEGLAGRAERMARLLGRFGGNPQVAADPPEWWGQCGEAAEATGAGDGTLVRVAFWVQNLRRVLDAIDTAAAEAGVKPAVGGSAGAGVLHARLDGDAEPAAVGRFVAALRVAINSGPGDMSWVKESSGVAGDRTPVVTSWTPAGTPGVRLPSGALVPVGDTAPVRGSVVVVTAPPGVLAAVDPWGPVPGIDLMRAVKDQFDPEHRMAPGRFAGGI